MAAAANSTPVGFVTDGELVASCLSGDREAFGRIVERYQGLLCSLAYSATGSLSESEDVAQEAFLDAWRQLGSLREPEKLRPWLCGILRHKVGRLRRSDRQEPVRQAEGLENAEEMPSTDEPTAEFAMGREEQAILWSALERVPQIYREPLILYYREHRSIEHVAVALDLSEDAVKQRLARGRKILQERVLSFVEGALSRSTPGCGFTLSVVSLLPALVPPAKAVGMGTAAAVQGGLLAKSTGLAGILSSLSGVVSAALALRANLDQSRTPAEKRAIVRVTCQMFFGALAVLGLAYLIRAAAFRWPDARVGLAWAMQTLTLLFVVGWPMVLLGVMRGMRTLRSAERKRYPELFRDPRDQVGSTAGEYRSRWTLMGVPLVHFRFASPDEGQLPVLGWVAGGDRAYGLLFAWGGLAVAPFSIGSVAVGIVAIGSLSVGVLSLGTVAVGGVAFGCNAAGHNAFGWLSALGWVEARGGGFAIARFEASGPIAWAEHANGPVAVAPDAWSPVVVAVVSVIALVPVVYYARAVRQRLGPQR